MVSRRSAPRPPVRLDASSALLKGKGSVEDDDALRATVLRMAGKLRRLERGLVAPIPGEAVVERPEALLPHRPDPSTVDAARRLPLFDDFSDAAFAELIAAMTEWCVPSGHMVFSQGAPGGSAYLVVRGRVEVWTRRGGKEYRLALGGPGTLLGEVGLIDRRPRTMSARSRGETVLLELSVDAFVRLWNARSEACRGFVRVVGRGVSANLHRAETLEETDERRGLLKTFVPDDVPSSGGAPIGVLATRLVQPAGDAARLRAERQALLETIAAGVVGRDSVTVGPFGERRVVDAAPGSSARALHFVEDFLREEVLGADPARLRILQEEARAVIRGSVGATDDDQVLFVSGGARGCALRLVEVLLSEHEAGPRPVVFLGPYEGVDNDLPWRRSGADVVFVALDDHGGVDLADLETKLRQYADRPMRIGSFSGGSDVTGVLSDDLKVTRLLHRYAALSVWDFSGVAGRVSVSMNPNAGPEFAKDALFFSLRSFAGAASTPAVLVVKKRLLARREEPSSVGAADWMSPWSVVPAGGTRGEEGDAVDAVGAVRAGVAVHLRDVLTVGALRDREDAGLRRALDRWRGRPELWILGRGAGDRVAHLSFCIRHEGRFLHWGFVAALLRDVYGIRVGAGVSGAGPYAHSLLGLDLMTSWTFEEVGREGYVGLSPGWVTVVFGYWLSDGEIDYLIEAIEAVARDGWRLLPLYRFDPTSGAWSCVEPAPDVGVRLGDIRYPGGAMHFESGRVRESEASLQTTLHRAREIFDGAIEPAARMPSPERPKTSARFESVRWFPYPHEAREKLLGLCDTEEPTSLGLDPQEIVGTIQE